MNIVFDKVILHHFLSFSHAEIDLSDKGFCLINGTNLNPKDSAKSNGSGKSSIWSAICYALTGETIQGLKSNLSNIVYNDGCWVKLLFKIDNDDYELLRSKDDDELGTNLKIKVNGEDKSGKGIRESQEILSNLLPDITSELLGSVIILGQGLPQRFTSNSPSGRKEVLEQLSKSDYMIQDLKDRIGSRISKLNSEIREHEDTKLEYSSKEKIYQTNLDKLISELESLQLNNDFEDKILSCEKELQLLNKSKQDVDSKINVLNEQYNLVNSDYLNTNNKKQELLNSLTKDHKDTYIYYSDLLSEVKSEIFTVTKEISSIESITDICPTCGQKIPGIIKKDTSDLKEKLNKLNLKRDTIISEMNIDEEEYSKAIKKLEGTYSETIQTLNNSLSKLDNNIKELRSTDSELNSQILQYSIKLTELNTLKTSYFADLNKLEFKINDLKEEINNIKELISNEELKINSINEHLEVVNKMNTLVKRDFRGYLLLDIIEYINVESKKYAKKIFGSDEIEFVLEGNNINISYCGKEYENLSGGEKQRLDLIIQFAIRKMMCQYLNFSSNILVLDEITDALDSVSCDKVLEFISNELSDIESVFIISHHVMELDIPYDNIIEVVKRENGVSEVM